MEAYKIYYRENDKKNFVERIEGTQEDALNKVKEKNSLNDGHTYYWQRITENIQLDSNGKERFRADSPEELFDMWDKEDSKWHKINRWIRSKTIWKIQDAWYWLKEAYRRVFYRWDIHTSCDFNQAFLDMLIDNVPKIVTENDGGCPHEYLDDRVDKHGNPTEENWKQGHHLWYTDCKKLVLQALRIRYYDSHGYLDDKEKKLYKECIENYPIPYIEGSEEIDYKKLEELRNECKNYIFDFLKKNIECLWD